MKFLLVLASICSLAITAEIFRGRPELDSRWQTYKAKHAKNYTQSIEEQVRRKNWEARQAIITAHNQEALDGKHSFFMSTNPLSDLDSGEFAKLLAAKPPKKSNRVFLGDAELDELLNRQSLPASVDWRTSKCMPPVKNQGACGSCWAFSANTPLEFSLCNRTGRLTLLSEQQLVDCSSKFYNYGCGGGWYVSAWDYVKAAPGEAASTAYPYTAKAATCKYKPTMSAAKVSSSVYIEPKAASIQKVVAARGPVAAALQVISSFRSYSSGVYSDAKCPKDGETVNHAIVIVGYGTLNKVDYWIVRNSWGTNWGSKGYILVRRGVNMCNIESWAAYPTI